MSTVSTKEIAAIPQAGEQETEGISSPLESAESDPENESTTGLSQAMKNLSIVTSDDSPYTTESTGTSSASDSSSNYENQTLCRLKLNEFRSVSGKGTIN